MDHLYQTEPFIVYLLIEQYLEVLAHLQILAILGVHRGTMKHLKSSVDPESSIPEGGASTSAYSSTCMHGVGAHELLRQLRAFSIYFFLKKFMQGSIDT